MNNIEQIKENIRTINPNFTDELLDLLYEYFKVRQGTSCHDDLQILAQNKEYVKFMQDITLGSIFRNHSEKKY